jgi:heterogeneous nuclear ribonucleoprotein F/H
VNEHGRNTGIAFVEFPSPQEAAAAMGKNKQMMGNRYIEMFPATRSDLDKYRSRDRS